MTFVDSETPAGAMDGTNRVFTLAGIPLSGSLQLFRGHGVSGNPGDGAVLLKMGPNDHFTIYNNTITFTPYTSAPAPGDWLIAFYKKA